MTIDNASVAFFWCNTQAVIIPMQLVTSFEAKVERHTSYVAGKTGYPVSLVQRMMINL
jgi:hypothetical protein